MPKRPFSAPSYDVGYGKPPRDSRFKPGQSGNPRGRPAGSKRAAPRANEEPMKALVLDEAYRRIKVRDGERMVGMPVVQAILRSLALSAAKGHQRSQRLFTELVRVVEHEKKRPLRTRSSKRPLNTRWAGNSKSNAASASELHLPLRSLTRTTL
jgi:hypothetical protein